MQLASLDHPRFADLLYEGSRREEALAGDATDRHDQRRSEQLDFSLQPWAAVGDFPGIGHAIAAVRVLTREAAADGSDVHAGTELLFVEPEREEPLEELFARR